MDKKPLIGVTIIGIAQMLIGIVAIFFALYLLLFFISPPSSEIDPFGRAAVVIPLAGCVLASPFLLLGIMVLKLKPIARKINIYIFPVWLTLVALIMWFVTEFYLTLIAVKFDNNPIWGEKSFLKVHGFLTLIHWIIVLLASTLPIIYFTRPKVRSEFR